jgi:hypothetical protein
MRTQRQVVDYSLQKRAVLREVYAGRMGLYEVCDASPYLKNAAKFHGEPTGDRCPICRRENLTLVHYIYGDELRQSAGQARSRSELVVLAAAVREFQVYVVEVCRGCDWNHLAEQYLLGHAVPVDVAGGTGPDGTGQRRPDGAAPAAATVRHGRPASSARVMAVAAGTSGRRKRGARA